MSVPVSAPGPHPPATCAGGGQARDPTAFIARTGVYVLERETDPAVGLGGLPVRHEQHRYGELSCRCGQVNRREPGRCPPAPLWTAGLTEWQLVGPLVVSLLGC